MQLEHISFEDLRQTARNAYNNVSFSPEKRGDSVIRDYEAELNDDRKQLAQLATENGKAEQVAALLDDYTTRYRQHLTTWLYAMGRCISSMITGPAKFPTQRAEKANRSEQNRYNDFRTWRDNSLKRHRKHLNTPVVPVPEIDKARTSLASRQKVQQLMKDTNKIISSQQEVHAGLSGLGYSAKQISDLLTPNWAGRLGYEKWQLDNNSAEIRRLKQRISDLEAKEAAAKAEAQTEYTFEGGTVLINREIDRVQLFYAEKPDQDARILLKRNGFKWSPNNGCWQRQDTPAARISTQRITQVSF